MKIYSCDRCGGEIEVDTCLMCNHIFDDIDNLAYEVM